MSYLEKKFPKWKFQGSDNNNFLIKHSRKNTRRSKIFFDDVEKKLKKKISKANIIFSAGVIQIFDNVELFLKQLISRGKKSADIYIHSIFNPYPLDMIIRLRNCNQKNFIKKKIDIKGWNRFSIKTISSILSKSKKVKSFKFIKVNFPKNIKVKKVKDPARSWTEIYNNRLYFISGTNMLEDYHFLHIKLK